jgi:DNA polymerase
MAPPKSDSARLWSSLGVYLEELAESGLEGLPAGETALAMPSETRSPIPVVVRQSTVASQPDADDTPHHESLEKIRKHLGDCQRCKLGKSRTNLVFGTGNPHARLVFVGEGPGADEDRLGEPFVGKAGGVLSRLITAMGLSRQEVYICNVVKCRPPGNRDPEADEIAACSPFLLRQLRSVNPEVIVALGKPASHTLLGCKETISRLRGRFHDFQGVPLMSTYHPSYLLRKQEEGSMDAFWEVWDDMTQVLRLLKLPVPEKGRKPR